MEAEAFQYHFLKVSNALEINLYSKSLPVGEVSKISIFNRWRFFYSCISIK
jgi:hypothetical protein